jgi:DNA-binding transcriptional MerR regulator
MEDKAIDREYSAEELEALSSTARRTIRYYIQLGLVDRPMGETRAARYGWRHLQQLLDIRRFTEEGFSLERVGELMRGEPASAVSATPSVGSISVRSHVQLASGLELVIDPGQAGLESEQLRRLIREILAAHQRITQE